jgi:plasmid stabilization system protein ParE
MHTKHLAEFPELGRVVPEFDIPTIREIVVRSYRVIYRVNHANDRVDVIRFWHSARGTPEIEVA